VTIVVDTVRRHDGSSRCGSVVFGSESLALTHLSEVRTGSNKVALPTA
jgi:hypothetical protein